MKNILVTGGAGFIGSNLIKRLFTDLKGATIVNIDNMNAFDNVSFDKEEPLDGWLKKVSSWNKLKETMRPITVYFR